MVGNTLNYGQQIEGLENKQGGGELGDMLCLILKLFGTIAAILVHYRCVSVIISFIPGQYSCSVRSYNS